MIIKNTVFPVMKRILFLTLLALFFFCAAAFSQTITIECRDMPMKEVLKVVRSQSKYGVAGDKQVIENCRAVTLNVKNLKLEQFLELLFKNQPATYRIEDRSIFVIAASPASGPRKSIQDTIPVQTGVVVDSLNEPLPGVTVRVIGKPQAAVTDQNGRFRINATSVDSLRITFIGYREIRVPATVKALERIMMKVDDHSSLNEVVVVGYGAQKRADITGAISSIKPEGLPMAASTSVEQMLAGKAAGMQVRANDAQPGGAVEVLIRGAASTGAGNEPLYIIDGFPVSGGVDPNTNTRYSIGSRSPLNSINVNDIASIEVLKDASATSIYGARAANGVILITTKSGKQGKAKVDYDVKTTVQQIQRPWNLLNASQWMATRENYLHERWLVDNKISPYGNTDPADVDSYVPAYSPQEIASAGKGTDWIKAVTRTGRIQDHNLSISGATEKTNYLISGNYFDQAGVVRNNDFKRFSGRINITQQLFDWAKVGVKATSSRININNAALSTGISENSGILESAMRFTPTLPIKLEDGSYSFVPNSSYFPNPVSLLEIQNSSVQDRLLVQSFLELTPLKDLTVRAQLGMDKQEGVNNIYLPVSTIYGAAEGGKASINQGNRFDRLFNTTVTYRKDFLTEHHVDALLGYEWQSMGTNGFGLSNNKFSTDAFLTNNIGAGQSDRPVVASYRGVNELASYFGRVNYNFKGLYYLTLTMRADGSSRFGKDNRFGYFPSGAIAWRFNQYKLFRDMDWLSNAKLRFSAGQTGNSNISGAFAFYSFGRDYLFGNSANAGTYLSSYANDKLRWETTTEFNIGLDLGLWNDRVNIIAELFSKEVADLLGQQQLKTYLPLDNVAANLGKTASKGFELTINSLNTTGAVKWNTGLVLSAYRDRWKERSPDAILASYEGAHDPLRVHWGYVLDGLVKEGEVIPHMPGALAGTQKIKDINGYDQYNQLTGVPDGIINDADVVKIANQDPSFNFGISNTFQYKQFDLNIHVYGLLGILKWNSYMEYATTLHTDVDRGMNMPDFIPLFWSSVNRDARYPNMSVTNPFPGAKQFLLQKADFVRVRNITLGYNISKGEKSRLFFNNLRVFVDAANPFVFTSFKGVDPEYASAYPAARSYTIGINLHL